MGGTSLSVRELEVVRHAAHGLTNRVIAEKMSISEETVKSHMRHIINKLDAANRTHAVAIICMNAPKLILSKDD